MKNPDQIEQKDNIPERIQAAALRYKDRVFIGKGHIDAYDALERVFTSSIDMKEVEQGFMTDSGRFVDRNEAAEIAEKAKQYKFGVKIQEPGSLQSEHLAK